MDRNLVIRVRNDGDIVMMVGKDSICLYESEFNAIKRAITFSEKMKARKNEKVMD